MSSRTTLALVVALVLSTACRDRGTRPPDGDAATDPGDEVEQVCSHSYEVLIDRSGAGSPGVRSDFMTSCTDGARARRESLGEAAWTERTRCILAGETPEDLGRCDGREPPVESEPDPTEDLHALYVETCEHIFAIMDREIGPGLMSEPDLVQARENCVSQFDATSLGEAGELERQLRCMLDAESLEEIGQCSE